jgi:ribose/xylose/arabinose/galactoside ABC-type transport system permease subunit
MFLEKYCDMSIAVILGTFSMKMLSNGFVAIGLSSTVRDIVQGLFLLVLLVISANAGLFERRKADKEFAAMCNAAYNKN